MVVPVSLDEGRHEPGSPYYEEPEGLAEEKLEMQMEEQRLQALEEEKRKQEQMQAEAEAVAGPEGDADGE